MPNVIWSGYACCLTVRCFEFMDCHLNIIARAYYNDPAFGVFNLFTVANKSSYIDSLLARSRNAMVIADGLAKALTEEEEY